MSLLDGPWIHKFIVSNGIRLHYVTQGEGDLVLLLHGFPEFWYSWRHQIPKLADHHKVVALDLRGYNLSDKPQDPASYVLDELILDIVGVIDGLGYRRCHLVGHDWGGMVAWGVAYAVPDRIQALRVAGQGSGVIICQLLKGGIQTGVEHPVQLGQHLTWFRPALGRSLGVGDDLAAEDITAVRSLWQHVQTLVQEGSYRLLVLDELSLAIQMELLQEAEVLDFLQSRPRTLDVILTGSAMPESVLGSVVTQQLSAAVSTAVAARTPFGMGELRGDRPPVAVGSGKPECYPSCGYCPLPGCSGTAGRSVWHAELLPRYVTQYFGSRVGEP